MMGAGKDCTALFNKYHQWVNGDSMLAKCQIGVLSDHSDIILEDEEEEYSETPDEGLKIAALDSLTSTETEQK